MTGGRIPDTPAGMNFDIVVVGGGLGGSTLATLMARKGKKVLVLEREEKFKDRVRGEGMLNMYHPDLQETLLAGAAKAGVEIKRGANVTAISHVNGAGRRMVTFTEGGESHTVDARLVVGADGRTSRVREWGAFVVQ